MKNQKNYDAQLYCIPTLRCNLDCEYCINKADIGKPNKEEINPIKIKEFLKTLENTHKTFLINFSGGEPFLIPNFIEACEEITKKHFITFATNLTSNKIEEFARKINPKRVMPILASLHLKELDKKKLLDIYIKNFMLLKKNGFDIFASVVAYPPLTKDLDKYKKILKNKEIKISFRPFSGRYNGKEYPHSYSEEELKKFNFEKNSSDIKMLYQYKKICNAGYNVGVIGIKGDISPCFFLKMNMGNIYKEIKFNKYLILCPLKFCSCPVKKFNPYLYNKALEETKKIKKVNSGIVFFQKIDRQIGRLGIFLHNKNPKLYCFLKKIKRQ